QHPGQHILGRMAVSDAQRHQQATGDALLVSLLIPRVAKATGDVELVGELVGEITKQRTLLVSGWTDFASQQRVKTGNRLARIRQGADVLIVVTQLACKERAD